MYLARELTDQTLPAIGRAFGGRNHTTVMHACRRTAERIAEDPEAYEIVRRLTEQLGGADESDAPDRLRGSCTGPVRGPSAAQRRSSGLCTPSTAPDDLESPSFHRCVNARQAR